MKAVIAAIAFPVLLICALGTGWVLNVVKLVNCDFKAPYKAEVIRAIGVFVPPIGVIAGYITINDD